MNSAVADPPVEFGLSTSMVKSDVARLPLFGQFEATHVEIGFLAPSLLEIYVDYVRGLGRTVGFHDPLPFDQQWRWPSMTDPDPAEQARSLGVMERTIATAAAHNAAYALTNFPSVHFNPVAGWNRTKAIEAGHKAAGAMARWGKACGIPILLENVGPNPYWDAAAWIEIFEANPSLGFCLDMGHLHLETRADHAADVAFVRALAPYTRQVHVYNATLESYYEHHHVPVGAWQDPADGWIDVPELLAAVRHGRRGPLRIVFEHTNEYPAGPAEVADGMAWVRGLFSDR